MLRQRCALDCKLRSSRTDAGSGAVQLSLSCNFGSTDIGFVDTYSLLLREKLVEFAMWCRKLFHI